MKNTRMRAAGLALALAAGALAQEGGPPPPAKPRGEHGPPPPGRGGPGAMGPGRPRGGPAGGRWWTDPALIRRLGLSEAQQAQIVSVYQTSRLKLIDLNAALQKEEAVLEPLIEAERPDQSRILPQIDRVADARAEFEKANARMLLGLRAVLTQEQWKRLQGEESSGRRP